MYVCVCEILLRMYKTAVNTTPTYVRTYVHTCTCNYRMTSIHKQNKSKNAIQCAGAIAVRLYTASIPVIAAYTLLQRESGYGRLHKTTAYTSMWNDAIMLPYHPSDQLSGAFWHFHAALLLFQVVLLLFTSSCLAQVPEDRWHFRRTFSAHWFPCATGLSLKIHRSFEQPVFTTFVRELNDNSIPVLKIW